MKVFVRVVETGSFSAIARENATTQSAVSKQVAALEAHLGAKLLSRSTRALSLTEEGEAFFPEARRLVVGFRGREGRLRSGAGAADGLAARRGLGRLWPAHPDAARAELSRTSSGAADRPQAQRRIHRSDRTGDRRRGAARRSARQQPGRAQDRRLAARARRPSRLFRQTARRRPEARASPRPAAHNCIVYTEVATQNAWEFIGPDGETAHVRVAGNLQTNSSEAIRAAALSGLGVCHAPELAAAGRTRLRRGDDAAAGMAGRPIPIHAVYPTHRRHVAKIEAFVAHLSEHGSFLG